MAFTKKEYYEWLEDYIKLEKQIGYYEDWVRDAKNKIHSENRIDIVNATFSSPIFQQKEIEFLIEKYKENKYNNKKDKILIEKFFSLKKEFEDFYNKNKELYDKKLREDIIFTCEQYLTYTNPPEDIFELEEASGQVFVVRNSIETVLIEYPFLKKEIEKYQDEIIKSDNFIKNNAKRIIEEWGIDVRREFYPKSYWWWHLDQFLTEEDKKELKKKGILYE